MLPSLLPVLTENVPGLFTTARGVMGYGVSGGAAGGISLRGLSGGTARMMVLIDGHPQYAGIFGHPIADAYQSLLADKVEVLRGPASVLYGSNAMGGVINIVTRKMHEDGVHTNLHAGYGSYNTVETELTNMVRKGRFSSVISGSYNRTDGHRDDMGFEQYGGYAKLGYDITDNWNMYADGPNSEDKALDLFAEMMIEKIESIRKDWKKPWFTEGALQWPKNLSGREYNGMNAFMLLLHCENEGYKIPRFCTFDCVQRLNNPGKDGKELPRVSVLRGEKSFPVMLTTFTCIHK